MAQPTNGGTIRDLEAKLWQAADKLRGHLDAAEYKHVVLGLIFLKYISDSFQSLYDKLQADSLADPEDRDQYLAENIFFVLSNGSMSTNTSERRFDYSSSGFDHS